jgi:hypothetical protein
MRLLIIFLFSCCILSCGPSVPKDVLPPKKMQSVLWDMMQADEMAEYYSAKDTSYRGLKKHVDFYQKVFSIHKISKEKFNKSLSYYENHPADFKRILDSLHSYVERLQSADTLKKKPGQSVLDDTTLRKPPIRIMHH